MQAKTTADAQPRIAQAHPNQFGLLRQRRFPQQHRYNRRLAVTRIEPQVGHAFFENFRVRPEPFNQLV